jgi:addiction module HigA family antidote
MKNTESRAKLKPIAPGEILKEEFLDEFGISQNRLARDIDVPPSRINNIIKGRRSITPDLALRLSIYFNNSPEFWLRLQNHYDIAMIHYNDKYQMLCERIRKMDHSLRA